MGAKTKANTDAWHTLKGRLVSYGIREFGQTAKLARYLKTADSQVHRWMCPVCEHDAEPSYSVGKQLEIYLETIPFKDLRKDNSFQPASTGRKCCICHTDTRKGDEARGWLKIKNKWTYTQVHRTCLVAFAIPEDK